MSETAEQPVFSIEKLYVKDLSLEVPNAPQIYLEREAPQGETAKAEPVEFWPWVKEQSSILLMPSSSSGELIRSKELVQPFRRWFTAAAWAYYINPHAYVKAEVDEYVLRKLQVLITGETRDVNVSEHLAMPRTPGRRLLEHFWELERSEKDPYLDR